MADTPSGVPDATNVAELLDLVDKLRRIPDSVRNFSRDADWAWSRLRIRPDVLRFLLEEGLPRQQSAGAILFDRYDLLNCSLLLGKGTVARAVRRFWPIALRRAAEGIRSRYEMQFQTRCPQPGHAPTCHYAMALPGGDVLERVVDAGAPPGAAVEVSPVIDWPDLPHQARAAVDELRDLQFVALREPIRWDTDFIRRSGLADCAGGATLLADAAARRGIPARRSFGYIVAPPFAVEHHWTELSVSGVWVPVDPVLIRNMVKWRVLDPVEWPPYRSIGPLVARLAGRYVPVVRHEGTPIAFTLPVRLLPEEV